MYSVIFALFLLSAYECLGFSSQGRIHVKSRNDGIIISSSSSSRIARTLVLSASTIEQASTAKPESARLTKAKKLLEQFQKDEADPDPIGGPILSVNNVVPDTYWRNGHLEAGGTAGGVVTRWARGVKVAEPLVKYDPEATAARLFRQPAKWLIRNIQIAFPLGWWATGVVLDYFLVKKSNRLRRAQQLRMAISNLGPAIIKGGQALASRPDLLPSEYLNELQKLQDDVPRFSNAMAFRTVEEELGIDNFSEIFELVENEPIAAASIGQVYKAILRENGETVALKIQRPKCEEIIALDLYILRWWSGVYNGIFRLLNRDIDLQSVIDDFGVLIYREIDYVAEAANAQRFNELYAGLTDIFVPKVYSDFTTNKVLTMEWVDGFRLTDSASLAQYNLNESKLVDTLVQCSLRQILGTLSIVNSHPMVKML
jgi:ABC1 atypical kinase-like domain